MSEKAAVLESANEAKIVSGNIHPTAQIDPSAKLAANVKVGAYAVIGPNVEVGAGSEIAAHAIIDSNTRMGRGNKVYSFAAIGGDPQDLSYHGEPTWLEIGDHNIFREYCTINRGSVGGGGVTRLGNKNCFLAYSHVAHDCTLADEILVVSNALIAGHARIDSHAILGAFTAVHQFCHVGEYTFLSRASGISQDVPPYMLVTGAPGVPCSLNKIALKRAGFSADTMLQLKRAFKVIYRQRIKMDDVKAQLAELAKNSLEVGKILSFIENSERGICRRAVR